MFRPWKGVLSAVVLGLVAIPSTAMAQSDTTPPTVTIVTPAAGATYNVGQPVSASYSCADASTPVECVGSTPNGAAIDTSQPGNFSFTVTARDAAGNPASEVRNYSVAPVQGGVGGETPPTLTLVLGATPSFSAFIPGVARDYLTTTYAMVTSSAGNAMLSVSDPSSASTGRLVNGSFALQNALQMSGASALTWPVSAPMGPVGGATAPLTLVTYDRPFGLDAVLLTFKQSITQTEGLRTGTYAKTLTFTVSTTNP